MADKIAGSIDQQIKHMQGQTMSSKNIAKAVADAVFQSSLLDGKVLETVVERSIQSICFNTYTPLKLLREMDMAGVQLSITGVEVARRVQTGGKKYFRGSILPCHADIIRAARYVECVAQKLIPFEVSLVVVSTSPLIQKVFVRFCLKLLGWMK